MRILIAAFAAAFIGTSAAAIPIAAPGTEGFKVIASGGEVIAKYEGNTASFINLLFLDNGDTDFTNDLFIFNNQTTPVGTTLSLGTFATGTELLFRMLVTNTGNNFFTGPASRNPDDKPHARVESDYLVTGTTLVSFEDLFNGPFDYNDLSFSFTNTGGEPAPIPVPAAFGLLAAALGSLGLLRRKRA